MISVRENHEGLGKIRVRASAWSTQPTGPLASNRADSTNDCALFFPTLRVSQYPIETIPSDGQKQDVGVSG
ncbi:hypothetical protein CGMCC3_g9289 [Colletotrichum fructicola]|nr:uncharacterized protein CGMCC3_g9289 [Colletotrichum fructicola]KAE9574573.1 hypothetical protein CGMCC3_g9289 [Colletotrichum fructicola]